MATLIKDEYYIIVPAEATNEITNPSFEWTTTGYSDTGGGVAIARSTTQQRRGLWSLRVTPVAGSWSGVRYSSVNEVAGVDRTFSVDIFNPVVGETMYLQITDNALSVLSQTTFVSNGYWQRISVTRTGTANTTRKLALQRGATASTTPFYTDGWYYSTVNGTYFDGDSRGFNKNARQPEYRWLGTPHASASWRSGQTRSGGTLLKISDYARILLVLGLGMGAVTNVALPMMDHSAYQTTHTKDREIVFSLAFWGSTPGDLRANRDALINAVRPDRTAVKQPLVIRYQGYDASGNDATEPVDILAHYVDGLENTPDNYKAQQINLRFTSYLPFLQKSGETGVGLGYNTTVANFANIGYRDVDGTWKAMGTGVNGSVTAIVEGVDGSIYVSGMFTSAGGVANTRGIAKWDGSTWTALGTGLNNGWVNDMAVAPNGDLYVVGSFTQVGGVANTVRVARWNGSTWNPLSTGISSDNVNAIVIGPDGYPYIAGSFTNVGSADGDRIVYFDGAAFQPLSTGADDTINSLTVLGGEIYAFGRLQNAGGVATPYLAKWNGSAWSSLISSLGGVDPVANVVTAAPDGSLYISGEFDSVDGISANNIARWNGSAWSALGSGVNGIVSATTVGPDGMVYVGGYITHAGGVALPDFGAVWTGSCWLPVDIDVQDALAVYEVFAFDRAGRLYLGGSWTGTDALSATVTVSTTNNLGQYVYPVIRVRGPGTLYQFKNYTTGKALYFNALPIFAGEDLLIDLRPEKGVTVWSSFWGGRGEYLLPGSTTSWELQNGPNNVSALMLGTTAASGITMTWQDGYWSIDGAKR